MEKQGKKKKDWEFITTLLTVIISTISLCLSFWMSFNSNNNAKKSNDINNKQLSIVSKEYKRSIKLEHRNSELSQANKFSIWVSDSNLKDRNGRLYNDVTIQNNSGLPMYEVYIFMHSNSKKNLNDLKRISSDDVRKMEIVPPGKLTIRMYLENEQDKRNEISYILKDTSDKFFFRSNLGNLKTYTELHYKYSKYDDLIKFLGLRNEILYDGGENKQN